MGAAVPVNRGFVSIKDWEAVGVIILTDMDRPEVVGAFNSDEPAEAGELEVFVKSYCWPSVIVGIDPAFLNNIFNEVEELSLSAEIVIISSGLSVR